MKLFLWITHSANPSHLTDFFLFYFYSFFFFFTFFPTSLEIERFDRSRERFFFGLLLFFFATTVGLPERFLPGIFVGTLIYLFNKKKKYVPQWYVNFFEFFFIDYFYIYSILLIFYFFIYWWNIYFFDYFKNIWYIVLCSKTVQNCTVIRISCILGLMISHTPGPRYFIVCFFLGESDCYMENWCMPLPSVAGESRKKHHTHYHDRQFNFY